MQKWEAVLKLKTGAFGLRRKTGFCFEWKAWLIGYSVFDLSPDDFAKMDPEGQFLALAYGAACWYCFKHNKIVWFTYPDIVRALDKATKEENKIVAEAMKFAQFPEWFDNQKKKIMKAKP